MRTLVRPLPARVLRGSDTALVYAAVVLVVFTVLRLQPDAERVGVVQDASTNLQNLRSYPFRVLVLSAFVVPHPSELLVLVPLVAVVTAAQRWIGRAATLVALGLGHVGTTLAVGVVIAAGLTHGRLDPGIVRAPDVGVSYGLVCLVGLLTARVPRRLRAPWLLTATAALGLALALAPDFTALGHLLALGVGAGTALVAHRAARAALDARPPAQLP